MGQIIEITEDNVDELSEYLGDDMAENIGREYFFGLSSVDALDEPTSAIVWCVKNTESFDDAESEICFFYADNEDDGKELIDEYTERIPDDNVIRSLFEFEDIRDISCEILESSGFQTEKKEGKNLYGTLEEFMKPKLTGRKTPSYIVSLGSISQLQFRQGITNCMFSGRVGVNEDLAMLPMDWYEEDISSCMVTDEKVNGFFLIHRKPSGILMPVLLYASGVDAQKNMLKMLRFSVNSAKERYPGDTKVQILRHDEKTAALADHLLPGQKGKEVLTGERAEA